RGDAVAEALAEDHDVRIELVRLERVHPPRAAEVRLDLVEDEHRAHLAAELAEHLQVALRRMERSAAAEIGLRDEARDAASFGPDLVELRPVRRWVERRVPEREVAALVLREGDEPDARVAVLVVLAARHRLGQALLAVEAVAG